MTQKKALPSGDRSRAFRADFYHVMTVATSNTGASYVTLKALGRAHCVYSCTSITQTALLFRYFGIDQFRCVFPERCKTGRWWRVIKERRAFETVADEQPPEEADRIYRGGRSVKLTCR